MLSTPGPTISTSVPGLADFLHCAEITTRAKLDTSTARGERTGRCCSHRHHHARHATPIVMICAARPEAARQKNASELKIHAAARKHIDVVMRPACTPNSDYALLVSRVPSRSCGCTVGSLETSRFLPFCASCAAWLADCRPCIYIRS